MEYRNSREGSSRQVADENRRRRAKQSKPTKLPIKISHRSRSKRRSHRSHSRRRSKRSNESERVLELIREEKEVRERMQRFKQMEELER